jgi:hypothetical protein
MVLASPSASANTYVAGCNGTTGNANSLVKAINSADVHPGADTVMLGDGCLYTLTAPDTFWYGPDGLPPIASKITIEGRGSTIARSQASGTPPFRLFFVGADPNSQGNAGYATPGAGSLTLNHVTLTGGLAKGGDSNLGGGGAGMGGAIFNQGTVLVLNSTVERNVAQGGSSGLSNLGAIYGGGGMGSNGSLSTGGGFGGGVALGGGGGGGGAAGGTNSSGGAGGGGGFLSSDIGGAATGMTGGNGGGPQTGLGGGAYMTIAGDGSGAGGCGGGGGGGGGSPGGNGGAFGLGGGPGDANGGLEGGGGGGGVGGGGGGGECGGGGGFGGGGGNGFEGGGGGFGGGGATGDDGVGGTSGAPGFGGGTPTSSASASGAGMGGAIFNMQGSVTIMNSTFTVNTAAGGHDNVTDHGKGIGGAIFNLNGALTAIASTFARNRAVYAAGAPDQGAASIYNLVYDGHTARVASVVLRQSILADDVGSVDLASVKTAYITPAPLGTATANVSASDLVQTMAAREQGTITGNPLTSDPLLGRLANNGGPTQTLALKPGSPAIDVVPQLHGCPAADQRGMPRPDGHEHKCDIGAFESG